MERRSKKPDPEAVLTAAVRAAVAAAASKAPGLPLFAGGKSMGGRMTSLAQAREPLAGVRGLVFFGFPLHPAGRPSSARSAHLTAIRKPMLFLQGSRDPLADLNLLRPLCTSLNEWAELVVVEGGDHSFRMLRRSGRAEDDVLGELAATAASWAHSVAGRTRRRNDWNANDQR
jgi:predicted alpha/beta-hydrolase family hydrolase